MDDREVQKAVGRVAERAALDAGTVVVADPCGALDEGTPGLFPVDEDTVLVVDLREHAVETAEDIGLVTDGTGKFLHGFLLGTGFGVEAEGCLVDGIFDFAVLVGDLQGIDRQRDAIDEVLDVQELIFRAVETDVVISRALRDNGELNIVIPDDTVHDFIQGTVATDRVKADVLPCLLRLLCLLVAEPCGVAFASRVVDFIIDAGFFRCRNDTFFDDIDFLILPGVRVLQKIMLHTFSSKNSGFHACTRKPDIIHF